MNSSRPYVLRLEAFLADVRDTLRGKLSAHTKIRLPVLAWAVLATATLAPATFMPVNAADEAYGRVFFTPRDRGLLDDARRRKVTAAPPKAAAPRPVAPAAAPEPKPERPSGNVTLNGIVRRSDGEATIWVNGVAMPADAQTGKVQVSPTSTQSGVIRMPNSETAGNVELKVGQKLDLSSGSVTERYANRAPARATPAAPRTPAVRPPRRPARTETEDSESR